MARTSQLTALSALLAATAATAQAGNETIFVGTDMATAADNHLFVESGSGSVLSTGNPIQTNRVAAAVWAEQGRTLFVMRSDGRLVHGRWNGSSPAWTPIGFGPATAHGLGLDPDRLHVWSLMGPSNRELYCFDVDDSSATYGQVVTQTNNLSGVDRNSWCLASSGDFAAAPHRAVVGGRLEIVDTTNGSPTFLQIVQTTPFLGAPQGGQVEVVDCAFGGNDRYVYVLHTSGSGTGNTTSGIGVWDTTTQAWFDFGTAPGVQDLSLGLARATSLDVATDGSFAFVGGAGNGGWLARVAFDYTTPTNSAAAALPGTMPNCSSVAISPEQQRVAIAVTAVPGQPASKLLIFDIGTGGLLHSVSFAMWNVFTTAWQPESPTATYELFGTGCAGTLGVPAIAAAPGSRPALGATFSMNLQNLPFAVAAMTTGLSDTQSSTGLPLPFDLGLIGMPGCTEYIDPAVIELVVGTGTSGAWSWTLPSSIDLFGIEFFNQAYALDPAANAFGFTASNAGVGTLGF